MGHNHWISFHCVLCLWVAKNDTSENYEMHCETECLFEKKWYSTFAFIIDVTLCIVNLKSRTLVKCIFGPPTADVMNAQPVNSKLTTIAGNGRRTTMHSKKIRMWKRATTSVFTFPKCIQIGTLLLLMCVSFSV